jgi:hypothetical protein
MIRRGAVYGPPLPEGVLEDDGADRGLMFAFIGAHLGRQFEFVQSEWINDGVFFGAGDLAFLRRMTLIASLGVFLPVLVAAHLLDLGLGGVWAGIAAFIGVRMLLAGLRWRSRRWLVPGAHMVDERGR